MEYLFPIHYISVENSNEEFSMSFERIVASAVIVFLIVYLAYAMLYPEKF